jgi:hypothetical protein
MAVMGSTSENMYLCQVQNFAVVNGKDETGRLTCTRRKSLKGKCTLGTFL